MVSPFSKRKVPPLPPQEPKLSEDWKVGDLAVCVVSGDWDARDGWVPTEGKVYKVIDVSKGTTAFGVVIFGLVFTESPYCCWDNTAFRKVPPRKEEAADLAFRALFNRAVARGRRVREKVG